MEKDNLSVRRELFYAWNNFFEVADRNQFLVGGNLGVPYTAIKALDEEDLIILELSLRSMLTHLIF